MKDFSQELYFRTTRSSGSGGQNVNKVETSVTALWNIAETEYFTEDEKSLICKRLKNRINSQNVLQVSVSEHRTQLRNKNLATERIIEMVNAALIVPKKRFRTKPSKSQVEKRLKIKKQNSEKKQDRKFRI